MSFLNGLKSFFGGSQTNGARDAGRVYIVDAERMVATRDAGDRVGPVDRVQALQRLARFVEREHVRMHAVLAGRPLREVDHGGEFSGIKVFYAEQASGIPDLMLKLARDTGSKAVVIAADRQTEERAQAMGRDTIRTSTLRKAMEGGSPEGGDQGRHQQRRNRPRFGGGRRPQQQQGQQQQQPSQQPAQQQQQSDRNPAGPGTETTVKNLIDLVE